MNQAAFNESFECGLKEGLDRADKILENRIIQMGDVAGSIANVQKLMLLESIRKELDLECDKLRR